MFLGFSLVAALLGFTKIAAGFAAVARFLFGLFLLIFIVLLLMALFGVGTVSTLG